MELEKKRGRGMSPLDTDRLDPAVRSFVEILRELIKRSSLTQADLALELGVDPGTMSRYLAGHRVPPKFEFVTRLVELVVGRLPDGPPAFDNFGALRESYFSALRAKDPVRGHQFLLESQLNKMEEQVQLGELRVRALTNDLEAERSVRAQLELRINDLEPQAPEDQGELGALAKQLEEALSHIAVLEELLDQTQQALKLAQQDRQIAEARLTNASKPSLTEPTSRDLIEMSKDSDDLTVGEKIDVIAYELTQHLITLRFDERNKEADELRWSIVTELHARVVAAAAGRLEGLSRRKESVRLMRMAGERCTVRQIVELIDLLEGDSDLDATPVLATTAQRDSVTVARVIVGLDDLARPEMVSSLVHLLSDERHHSVVQALRARHCKVMEDGSLEDI